MPDQNKLSSNSILTSNGQVSSCGRQLYSRDKGLVGTLLFELATALLALLLLFVLSPVLLIVCVTLKIKFGSGSLFYRGIRLGRGKQEFVMYKFRTLPEGAQGKIGTELYSNRFNMLTPLTNFMRDTRLDELPQLVNVLKRDMDFIGPRPVRPEVYLDDCHLIPDYDQRFLVRPGLIGISQLYTPHSAPKRIRAYLDNWYVAKGQGSWFGIRLIVVAGYTLTRRLFVRLQSSFQKMLQIRLLRSYREKRILERVQTKGAVAVLNCSGVQIDGQVLDMNESCMKVSCPKLPIHQDIDIELRINCIQRGRRMEKLAFCSGLLLRETQPQIAGKEHVYVIAYVATTPLNHYRIAQYFLQQSIV